MHIQLVSVRLRVQISNLWHSPKRILFDILLIFAPATSQERITMGITSVTGNHINMNNSQRRDIYIYLDNDL